MARRFRWVWVWVWQHGRMSGVPVVDISNPSTTSMEALDAACRSHGFFLLEGHGLDDLIDRTWADTERFFALFGVPIVTLSLPVMLAIAVVVLLSILHVHSLRIGSRVQNLLTLFKIVLVIGFIGAGKSIDEVTTLPSFSVQKSTPLISCEIHIDL